MYPRQGLYPRSGLYPGPARDAIPVQRLTKAGVTTTLHAASAIGNAFRNTGRMILRLRNSGDVDRTAMFRLGGFRDGIRLTVGRTVTIPANGDVMTGIWPPEFYNQHDGSVWIDYPDTEADVAVAVLDVD